jgi:hypothetical protein
MSRCLVCGAIHLAFVAAYLTSPARAEGGLRSDRPAVGETCAHTNAPVPGPLVPVVVPGWRDRYPPTTVRIRRSEISGPSPPLRITSLSALAGLDQGVVVPSRTLTVVVNGRVSAGHAVIVVGWTEGTRVYEHVRILDLSGGSDTRSFRLPRNPSPLTLTVAVVRRHRRGILELDRVELRSGGRQLLRNAGLKPIVCHPPSRKGRGSSSAEGIEQMCLLRRPASGDPRLVRVIVPAWRDRYEQMNVLVPRPSNTSAPLRITSGHGLSGIDQIARVPRMPTSVKVRGRILSGAAQLVISWREGGHVREVQSALKLRRGFETRRVSLPTGTGPLAVTVGVVQLRRGGVIELDGVELESGGRQYLRNADLSFDVCPRLPKRPNAAFAMPVWLRWPATFLLLALTALALRRVSARAHKKVLPHPQRPNEDAALSRRQRFASLLFLGLAAIGPWRIGSLRSRRR